MCKPFFSIIVPVYNKERYVFDSINSIINQSFSDFEIIVVLDPSDDNSKSEVDKVRDHRIRVLSRATPGPGGYAARNLGVKEANGLWIKFLDADDRYSENHLETMFNRIQEVDSVDIHTCARLIKKSGTLRKDSFSRHRKDKYCIFSFSQFLDLSFRYTYPFHPNVIAIRSSFAKENMPIFPDGRTNRSGDIYAWIKLARKVKKFCWSEDVGAFLDKDAEGVSSGSLPNPNIFRELFYEIESGLTVFEKLKLKRFLNKIIFTCLLEIGSKKRIDQRMTKLIFISPNPFYSFAARLLPFMSPSIVKNLRGYKSLLLMKNR